MNDPNRTHQSGFRKHLSFSAAVRLLVYCDLPKRRLCAKRFGELNS